MKKTFNISREQNQLWKQLVEQALLVSDKIFFNVLYDEGEIKNEFPDLQGGFISKKKFKNKLYATSLVYQIPIVNLQRKFIDRLFDFFWWKNMPLEDPSFFQKENEILGSITHEDFVLFDASLLSFDDSSVSLFDYLD